jgi:hypothetical protein
LEIAVQAKTRSEIEKLFKKRKIKKREERNLLGCGARIISSALKMGPTRSSKTPVYNKPTRCHIPEDAFLRSHPP